MLLVAISIIVFDTFSRFMYKMVLVMASPLDQSSKLAVFSVLYLCIDISLFSYPTTNVHRRLVV